jgi:hypothetical protein
MPHHTGHVVDTVIAAEGVLIMELESPFHYLYTIGNTNHQCPELLIFCDYFRTLEYRDLLTTMSQSMQIDETLFNLHQPYTVEGRTFSLIEIDRSYIVLFAEMALVHYNHAPLRMMQLLTPDHNNCYPYEPAYDHMLRPQPICKLH